MPDFEVNLLRLLVGALSTWRISAILYYEAGPFDLFKHIRKFFWRHSLPELIPALELTDEHSYKHNYIAEFIYEQLSCFWCVSIWVSIIVTLIAVSNFWLALIPFALSGASILISGGGRTIWRSGNE